MLMNIKQEIKGSKEDIITVHMDTIRLFRKPQKAGGVVFRMAKNIIETTKESLVMSIRDGYAFMPGICIKKEDTEKKGTAQENWIQQDVFGLDFDNEGDKIIPITIDEAMDKLQSMGINVFLIYRSYSDGKINNGKKIEKFRFLFVTKETVKDKQLRDRLQATLMGILGNHIDPSCDNRNRFFYGTNSNKIVYTNYEAVIDAKEIIDTYWDFDSYKDFLPSDSPDKLEEPKNKIKARKSDLTEFKEVKEKYSKSYELIPVEEFPDKIPVVHNGLLKYNMQNHCEEYLELVEKILNEKKFVEGTGRRNIIFDVFNMVSFKYGTRKAYSRCMEINQKFEEPLTVKEFRECTLNSYEHIEENDSYLHETQYVYRYDTLLNRLGVTENEKENLSYYKNLGKVEHANQLRELKKERNLYIAELRNQGMGAKKIRKALIAKYGEDSELVLSLSRIKEIISNQGASFQTITNNNIIKSFFNLYSNQNEDIDSKILLDAEGTISMNQFGQESAKSKLNEKQQKALEDALNGSNILITGGAGVGKSYVIEKIIDELEKQGKKIGICAPSALAASSYDDGMTFHRRFGYSNTELIYVNLNTISRLLELDVIIIEEVGMLGKRQMDFMGIILEYIEEKYRRKPQIIMVGDFLQLPPINDQYCFESAYYKQLNLKPHYLIENIRQKGSDALFNALNAIRLYQDASKEINRICSKYEDFNSIYLVPKRDMAKDKNNECLKRLEGELIDLGNDQIVKIGAKIICTRNAYVNGKLKYYNGLQGIVVRVSKGKNIITIMDLKTEKLIRISRVNMEENEKEIKKFPIELGYAITIHKSQGMSLDSANIETKVFAPGQLYVALSRVKTAEGIHLLHPVRSKDIKCNKYSKRALEYDEDLRRQCGIFNDIHDAA